MRSSESSDARKHILDVSEKLFSEKGYDATRVSEIAQAAGINKAMIYYYFLSKESILDELVDGYYESISSIGMGFVRQSIVSMIEEGVLDILPDRFRFINMEAMRKFEAGMLAYYRQLLDFLLEKRTVVRIILLESLKNGRNNSAIFRSLTLVSNSSENPLVKTIHDADPDIHYSDDVVLSKIFFSLIPLMSFAAYFDEYIGVSGQTREGLKASFLRGLQNIGAGFVRKYDEKEIVDLVYDAAE